MSAVAPVISFNEEALFRRMPVSERSLRTLKILQEILLSDTLVSYACYACYKGHLEGIVRLAVKQLKLVAQRIEYRKSTGPPIP